MSRKFLSIFLVAAMSLLPLKAVMAFDDVSTSHSNYDAIIFLRDRGVVQGYEDGTFQPNGKINRAELTKIVVESLDVELVPGADCFPDVPAGEWYATYVCTAKELGWVQGHPDGNFKPGDYINNAESVKIIGEAEDWDLPSDFDNPFSDVSADAWYAPYVEVAENRNFLEQKFRFDPGADATRGSFSESYYRILYAEENNQEVFIDPNPSAQDDFAMTPKDGIDPGKVGTGDVVESDLDTYARDTFDNITLDEEYPKTFYDDELYYFDGIIESGSFDRIFLFMYPEGNQDDMMFFASDVSEDRFSIPVYMKETGDFFIGMIPGESGESVVTKISVKSSLPAPSDSLDEPSSPEGLSVTYGNDETSLNFDSDADIYRAVFSQGSKSVTYLTRQKKNGVLVDYSDFENFNDSNVSYYVEAANLLNGGSITAVSEWSKSNMNSFSAVKHHFSNVTDKVSVDDLPEFYSAGSTLHFRGTTSVDLDADLSVIMPDGFVDTDDSVTATVEAGESFDYSYTFSGSGTYIVEANTLDGLAVINHPVYESGKIPLIPDFFDLYPLVLEPHLSFSESAAVNEILDLINEARTDHGLDSVVLDSELSAIARAHSQDMKDNNFFAHVNLQGQAPNDRRVEAGYPVYVSENISKSVSIEHNHEGLMRSAIHRDNVLNPQWDRVGIGIVRDSEGFYYLTQEFSTSLEFIENSLLDHINDLRTSDITINDMLDSAADSWTELMVNEGFFNTSYNGEDVFDYIEDTSGFSGLQAFIIGGSDLQLFLEPIAENTNLEDEGLVHLGLGVLVDDGGVIRSTLIYSK